MEELKGIVGGEHFSDEPEILDAYSGDHSFAPPRKALAVVSPANTEKIKEIIDWANETRVPIIATSSGFPKFHGDTVPTCPGIMVDLSGLDQVLRVDQRNKIAVIEPGVTFGKLRAALEKEGMIPYTPLLPRSTKSVLASALEREPIILPKDHWDFNDPIAGGEVVIGDGHIQGFGDSAEHTKENVAQGKAVPVIPLGPSCIGWLNMIQGAQGTLGIVRWASVRCRRKPLIQKPFLIATQDLHEVIAFLQRIMQLRFVEETFILNSFAMANVLSGEVREIKKLQAASPQWLLFFTIAGYERYPEEEVEWKGDQLTSLALEEGLEMKAAVGGFSANALLKSLEKTAEKDRKLRFKDSCQVLPYSTTLDKTSEQADLVANLAAHYEYPSADLSIYIQPVIQGCQCQCEVVYSYDPKDERAVQKVKELYCATACELGQQGAYYTRPYGLLAGITYQDSGIIDVLKIMKGILDPNDILNSGKLY